MLKGSSKGKFQDMNFILIKDTEISFHPLRLAFTTISILCHLDPLFFIRMRTNASRFAISGILLQQHLETGYWHPVAF